MARRMMYFAGRHSGSDSNTTLASAFKMSATGTTNGNNGSAGNSVITANWITTR